MTTDKIYQFKDGVFNEYTGRLNTHMVQSYSGFIIKDCFGMPVSLDPGFGLISIEPVMEIESFLSES